MAADQTSIKRGGALWLLTLALLEGIAVMLLELSCGHVMSMHYGGNLRTWATVLAMTMAGLALGYFLGAKRRGEDGSPKLLQLLAWGSAIPAVLTYLWSNWTLMPNASPVLRALLGSAAIVFPAMAILGQILPRLAALSGAPGRLFAASTLGAVLAARAAPVIRLG